MASGKNTKEYIRLRENFSYVSDGIVSCNQVESLAQGLLEVNIVSDSARDEASNMHISKQHRASTLVGLVLSRVDMESRLFYVFLDVLRKKPILDGIVKKLQFEEAAGVGEGSTGAVGKETHHVQKVPDSDPSGRPPKSSDPLATASSFLDVKPKGRELQKVGNVRLRNRIAHKWKSLAQALEIESGIIQQIQMNNPNSADGCCYDLFEHWLSGPGKKPKTWRTLIDVLEDDLEETELCEELKTALQS